MGWLACRRSATAALRRTSGARWVDFGGHQRRHATIGRPPTDASVVNASKIFFAERLGFSGDKLKKLESTSATTLLTLGDGVLEGRVNWIKRRLRLKEDELKKITQAQPIILGHRSEVMEPKANYLQARLGLNETQMRQIILRAPNVLCFDIDNIGPKLDYLEEKLLLDGQSLRKLILGYPSILTLNTKDTVEPKIAYLEKRLGLSEEALQKTILRFPTILQYSIDDNYEPKLDWLEERLDLSDADLGRIIRRKPQIMGLSIKESLEPTLDWIQQRLSLTDAELAKIIKGNASFFGLSIDENLAPSMKFYIDALGDEGEAVALLKQRPVLFFYSLEHRLKPRLREARNAGLTIDSVLLKQLGGLTEKQWLASIEHHVKKQSEELLSA